MNPATVVGIDLGTTNSCVAIIENGVEVTVIHNELGQRTTPSVVAINEAGDILVGSAAKRQAITNPHNTVFGVKRLIGRKFESAAVKELRQTMPYEIVRAPNGDAWVQIGGRQISPQEISAHILQYMKRIAESYLGSPVDKAVVTVPAYFDDAQRQATKDAGKIAGLEVRSILNEPTAAALAYGVQKSADSQLIAVFDLGGGTFDISIMRLEMGVFEVLATCGDTFLGGDDFDRRIIEALVAEFGEKTGLNVGHDAAALQRLKEAAERSKMELSSTLKTDVNLPFLAVGPQGPTHLTREVSRAWIEGLARDLLGRLEVPCKQALADAGLKPNQIDQVVLVGGMTRMPAVEERAFQIFGKRPVKGVNPDEIVAIGAATQSAIMKGSLQEVVLLDVTSHSLGLRVDEDRFVPIIKRNTTIPAQETKVFATTEDNQDFVSIDVFQGDAPAASKNRSLGHFVLGGLPKAARGTVQVIVSFMLDADGILTVDAKETRTGRSTSMQILAASGLPKEEVERLARAHSGG